jgi:hypothetical protein
VELVGAQVDATVSLPAFTLRHREPIQPGRSRRPRSDSLTPVLIAPQMGWTRGDSVEH